MNWKTFVHQSCRSQPPSRPGFGGGQVSTQFLPFQTRTFGNLFLLCLPGGRPAENIADVILEAVKVWDDQPSFEGLVDQNDAGFDHPVDSEFFNQSEI